MAQRIGLLGGSFDPVHIGHLVLAVCARDQLAAERILLIPNARSPLKASLPAATFPDRLRMTELSVSGVNGLVVSDIEGLRGGISYTIDTLRTLATRFPQAEFSLILGADALGDFSAWKDHEEVARRAKLIGVQRGDNHLAATRPASGVIRMPRLDVSSTMIRERVARGEAIDFLTPASVVDYIRAHGLYRRA